MLFFEICNYPRKSNVRKIFIKINAQSRNLTLEMFQMKNFVIQFVESLNSQYLYCNNTGYISITEPRNYFNSVPSILIIFLFSFSENAMAQQQTAEGAQNFLSQIVEEGQVNTYVYMQKVKAHGQWEQRERNFSGSCRVTKTFESQDVIELAQPVSGIQNGSSENSGDVCVTSISGIKWSLDFITREKSRCYSYNGGTGLAAKYSVNTNNIPVPIIDWKAATVEKGIGYYPNYINEIIYTSGDPEYISVQSKDPTLGYVRISFHTKDIHLLNRIEYAMEFLKTNCDMKASTGF
jgi:hypothetical protein